MITYKENRLDDGSVECTATDTETGKSISRVVPTISLGVRQSVKGYLRRAMAELIGRPVIKLESQRYEQIAVFLADCTDHELYMIKVQLVHEEQQKRRGIKITKKPTN